VILAPIIRPAISTSKLVAQPPRLIFSVFTSTFSWYRTAVAPVLVKPRSTVREPSVYAMTFSGELPISRRRLRCCSLERGGLRSWGCVGEHEVYSGMTPPWRVRKGVSSPGGVRLVFNLEEGDGPVIVHH